MSEPVITVENLSKRYVIGHQRSKKDGLRHVLGDKIRAPLSWFRSERDQKNNEAEEFWALKDLSFEVNEGDVLGIIGRNGAGKSTLLKILSRITEPTTGRITINGRVASLLEVGTGFHADLTGRENIYLNGAILGMRRAEIDKKFDEIVAFSEVDKFLDTPVKRYSSGMYVRLAFGVAAHLEPEILIIDEVLAVGDAQFQKKCLGKMSEVAKSGRTVIFVSHNMASVSQLCDKAATLAGGKLAFIGAADAAVDWYLKTDSREEFWEISDERRSQTARKPLRFTRIEVLDAQRKPSSDLDVRKPFSVRMLYTIEAPLKSLELSVRVFCSDGRVVMTSLLSDSLENSLEERKLGTFVAEVEFPELFLMPGNYYINVAAHTPVGEIFDLLENVLRFTIADTGTKYSKYNHNHLVGVVMRDLKWSDTKS